MTHKGLKFSIAGAVLVAAVAYLGFTGLKSGWVYTLPVDQFMANVEQQKAPPGRVRLCGTVGEQDMNVQKGQLSAKFTLKGEHREIAVAYKGVVPEMFKAGSEVVVEGKRDAGGVFEADVLMTKCASKYEERPAGHPALGTENTKHETPNTKGGTENVKVDVGNVKEEVGRP